MLGGGKNTLSSTVCLPMVLLSILIHKGFCCNSRNSRSFSLHLGWSNKAKLNTLGGDLLFNELFV